jgi:hypothetical protein
MGSGFAGLVGGSEDGLRSVLRILLKLRLIYLYKYIQVLEYVLNSFNPKSIAFILILSLYLYSCSNMADSGGKNDQESVEAPFEISHEAWQMSLWLGDELKPDSALADRLQRGLNKMRNQYRWSIPQVDKKFYYPIVYSEIIFVMTDSAANEFLEGNYHAWDNLNSLFGLEYIRSHIKSNISSWVVLNFEGYLNPYILATNYDTLPGCDGAGPIGIGGDVSSTYPWLINDTLTLLVREAWGDCLSGCVYSNFFYFRENGDNIEFVGDYLEGEQEEPDWWGEAKVAFYKYRGLK